MLLVVLVVLVVMVAVVVMVVVVWVSVLVVVMVAMMVLAVMLVLILVMIGEVVVMVLVAVAMMAVIARTLSNLAFFVCQVGFYGSWNLKLLMIRDPLFCLGVRRAAFPCKRNRRRRTLWRRRLCRGVQKVFLSMVEEY